MHLVQVVSQHTGQVVSTQRVSKPVVGGCREDVLAGGELLNRPEALKFRCINDGGMRCGDEDVPVNFVPNHAVPTLHACVSPRPLFIALLGNQGKPPEDNC